MSGEKLRNIWPTYLVSLLTQDEAFPLEEGRFHKPLIAR